MTELVELAVDGGGSAVVAESDGNHVAVWSSATSPPGSTLQTTLSGRPLRIKVRGCRKARDDERPFWIEGRFVDVTKEQRAVILTSLTTPRVKG